MSDFAHYYRFTSKSRLDLSINSLLGIVEGIAADQKVTQAEIGFLHTWLDEHRNLADKHPYNELMPVVESAIADSVLTGMTALGELRGRWAMQPLPASP